MTIVNDFRLAFKHVTPFCPKAVIGERQLLADMLP